MIKQVDRFIGVSIPNGSIKRELLLKSMNHVILVSIPNGSIKSEFPVTEIATAISFNS